MSAAVVGFLVVFCFLAIVMLGWGLSLVVKLLLETWRMWKSKGNQTKW